MNERSDANMASVTCEESDNKRAIKVAPAAIVTVAMSCFSARKQAQRLNRDVPTGCTARPRVAPAPMVMLLFEVVDSSCTV